MHSSTINAETHIPFRAVVTSIVSGKYNPGTKPLSWDDRRAGLDVVLSSKGEEIILDSRGDQSTPDTGWEILINGKTGKGFTWTLYGVQKK